MRGSTNHLEGEFTAWDPSDPAPFTAAAGTRLLRVNEDGTVTVRSADPGGTEDTVHPGWLAFRADGSGQDGAVFVAPGNVSDGAGTLFRAAASAP
jgi:hypothetical protein